MSNLEHRDILESSSGDNMYYIIENENDLYSIAEKHTEKIVLDSIKFKVFAEQFKKLLEDSYNKGAVDGYKLGFNEGYSNGYKSYSLLEEWGIDMYTEVSTLQDAFRIAQEYNEIGFKKITITEASNGFRVQGGN